MEPLKRIVAKLSQAWPDVRIIVRRDSGFCREPIMRWCEQNRADCLFGLAKNKRLLKISGKELHDAQVLFEQNGTASRVYKDFVDTTKTSWSSPCRVIGKAKHLAKDSNPRFIVNYLPDGGRWRAQPFTTISTVRGVSWRIGSKNSSCTCSPTGPALTNSNPINCEFCSSQWRMRCISRCGNSASREPR